MTAIRKIFISYRQSDNRAFVVRIRDWLAHKYGRDNVFMDFDTLPPFVKFEDFIKQRIAESDVILAIIGDGWLQAFVDKAAEGDKDYMLTELETALKSGKLIAPVLIMGAQMPRRRDMPENLRELCDYNAAELRDDRTFYDEIERVIEALEAAWGSASVSLPSSTAHTAPDTMPALPTADEYFKRGLERHQKGDYSGAISDLKEARKLGLSSGGQLGVWLEDAQRRLKQHK